MEGFYYVNMINFSYILVPMIEDLKLYFLLSMLLIWWLDIDLIDPL